MRRNRGAGRRQACSTRARVWLLVLGLSGCAGESGPPNLLVVVVDTLRADRLGVYGYDRPTSPRFDAFARRATTFERASSPSSWTKPSIASLFTSRYPSEHGALSYATSLTPQVPSLAELLQRGGYRTVGVAGNFVHLGERDGFARGFDVWETLSYRAEDAPGEHSPASAGQINERALELIDVDTERPLFLYVHYMEPHTPWRPPEYQRSRFARSHGRGAVAATSHVVELAAGRRSAEPGEVAWLSDLYDAEIATADAAFGELLDALRARGWLERAMVVVTADHGEEFGEHGGFFHGHTLHGELLQVPLLIRAPGQRTASRRLEPVDLLDIPTTVLAAAGIPAAESMRGRSLLGAVSPRELRAELYPESRIEELAGPRQHRVAVTSGAWKTIVDYERTYRSYRLDEDPNETTPIASGSEPGKLKEAVERAVEAFAHPVIAPSRTPDAEQAAALRSLGYVE